MSEHSDAATRSTTAISLSDLPENGQGRVLDVVAESDDAIRLKSLGICIGRRVQAVKAGDPLIVRVMGARVGLSARLAATVVVEPLRD
jgi:Fe2+ transport system protein FeoA